MPVVKCDPTEARKRLEEAGVKIQDGNTEHELWRARHRNATAVAYDGKIVIQGKSPVDIQSHLEAGPEQAYLYFDGASRGNPGEAAVGWVLVGDGGIIAEDGQTIGKATNNQAEYDALLAGLEAAAAFGVETLTVHGDSELIIKQLTGEYQTRNPELKKRRVEVHELLQQFASWELSHVPREINDRADRLANEALDG